MKRRDLLIVGCLAATGAVGQARAWQPRPDTASFMVFFAENSAELAEHAVRALERGVGDMNGRYDGPIELAGYTDREERAPGLAARRAEAVRDKLVTLGIDVQRISIRPWVGPLPPPGSVDAEYRSVGIALIRRCVPNCPEDEFQDAGSSRD